MAILELISPYAFVLAKYWQNVIQTKNHKTTRINDQLSKNNERPLGTFDKRRKHIPILPTFGVSVETIRKILVRQHLDFRFSVSSYSELQNPVLPSCFVKPLCLLKLNVSRVLRRCFMRFSPSSTPTALIHYKIGPMPTRAVRSAAIMSNS